MKSERRHPVHWVLGLLIVLFLVTVVHAQAPITFQYFYDEVGQMVKVVDSTGNVIEYVYDEVGNILEIKRSTVSGLAVIDFNPKRGQSGASGGSPGRIRLEAFHREFTGTANPVPSLATPFAIFLPNNLPSVRVVAIEGEGMPEVPSGSFAAPDITINQPAEAVAMVEAQNVPAGTLVQIHVFSENGPDQIIDSAPLEQQPSGALTATANVVFPTGFSRIFARAKWTNP